MSKCFQFSQAQCNSVAGRTVSCILKKSCYWWARGLLLEPFLHVVFLRGWKRAGYTTIRNTAFILQTQKSKQNRNSKTFMYMRKIASILQPYISLWILYWSVFLSSTKTRLVLHAWSFLSYWMKGLVVGAWGPVVKKPPKQRLLWTKCFWLSFLTLNSYSCDKRYFILTCLTGLMSKIYWTIQVILKCSICRKAFSCYSGPWMFLSHCCTYFFVAFVLLWQPDV